MNPGVAVGFGPPGSARAPVADHNIRAARIKIRPIGCRAAWRVPLVVRLRIGVAHAMQTASPVADRRALGGRAKLGREQSNSCIFVKRIIREILKARRYEDHPGVGRKRPLGNGPSCRIFRG
jgi:hypothetical protein